VENLFHSENVEDVKDNDHGAIENRCRDPYLARQLSISSTGNTLRGVPRNSFRGTTASIGVISWT
jgi:hypothetical protein